ncbi:MAG TPA: trigger factor [Halanaerobiales bacterium]|nr:trigger factor [Halanaerobiales bacterium]
MEVTKNQLEGNKVELKVEIEAERVNEALEQAYKKVVKDIDIDGFRKGKVPRRVLEARYGKEILHKDALDILIPEGYREALEETGIEPIDQPDIEDYHIAEDEPASFTAVVEVKPEVELGEYKELGIEKESAEVSEEEIQEEIDKVRNQHSQLVASDKEVVEDGDFVIIDFEGKKDGEPFPGGSAEEYSLEIGSNTFIPGFEEQLIGAKVGDELELNITFPEDYNAKDLAGEEVVFDVEIKELKEKELPELDDEFAKEVSDYETFEEYKESIKERLQENKEERTEREYENKLIEKASENAIVDVPEKMVEDELNNMFQNFAQSVSQQGMEVEDYLDYMGTDEEGWKEQNKEAAENRTRSNLVLEAIAEQEDIEVSEEEIEEQIQEIAESNDQDPEQIKAFLQMQGQLDGLKDGLQMQKTIEYLKENN